MWLALHLPHLPHLLQIIIPYRGDHYDVLRLKLVGDLGQVLFIPYHLCDEDAIRKAVKHSNIVINLVGRDWETRNFSFDKVIISYLLNTNILEFLQCVVSWSLCSILVTSNVHSHAHWVVFPVNRGFVLYNNISRSPIEFFLKWILWKGSGWNLHRNRV